MNLSFREILKLSNQHEVEYVVVGGVAAVIHGAPIATFDLDALVKLSEENASRLIRALMELVGDHRVTKRKAAKLDSLILNSQSAQAGDKHE